MKTKKVKTKTLYRFSAEGLTAVSPEEPKEAGLGFTHLEVKSEDGIPKEARVIKAKKIPPPAL